jgi:hypothetical protein
MEILAAEISANYKEGHIDYDLKNISFASALTREWGIG